MFEPLKFDFILCLSAIITKRNKSYDFLFASKGKEPFKTEDYLYNFYTYPNVQMWMNIMTSKTTHFPFETNGKWMVLGVPMTSSTKAPQPVYPFP